MAQVKSAETGTAAAAILGTHPDFDAAGSNLRAGEHTWSPCFAVDSTVTGEKGEHKEDVKKKNVMNRMNMCLGLSSTHVQTTIWE